MSLPEAPEAFIYGRLTSTAAITAIVGTKVFPVMAPQGTIAPLVIYQRMNVSREPSLTGPTGVPVVTLQLTSWASSYETAKTLAREIRLAVDGYTGTYGDVTIQRTNLVGEMDGAEMPTDDQMLPYSDVQQSFEFRISEAV